MAWEQEQVAFYEQPLFLPPGQQSVFLLANHGNRASFMS